jgi:2-polyprenyl-6-methoxyphenol hydroxylase-like FAD-dependent oxidoreductase
MTEPRRTDQTPVLIVGAGPTGLILAIWLKKRGIEFRLIDKSQSPGETSRAIAVQARTLEFYRQLGLAEKLIALGVTAQELVLRRVGRVVARARLGAMGENYSPYPYLLFCSQDVHESMLCEELACLGVQVERQSELVEFTQHDQAVTATIRTPRGTETVTADYLCGCDGAHSAVRHQLGVEFPGGTYSQVFYVADVMVDDPAMEEKVQISVSPKDFCIILPIKVKGSVRLTGIVPPESESKDKITFADVAEAVKRNTGLNISKVNWFSSYRIHHRVAPHFRTGRVFLAGDAGHIHSPAGGQGMNTGIGDAVNLAWKLADVIQGRASEKLLESYEPERIAFARTLVATTDTAFRIIASRSLIGSLFRAYGLPSLFAVASRFKLFLRFVFRTISQIRIKYRESILSQGVAGRVYAGDRLPWVNYPNGDNFEPLQSLKWQVHIYGVASDGFRNAIRDLNIELYEFASNEETQAKGLLKDAPYLVRPDGHIAWASRHQDSEALKAYISRFELRPRLDFGKASVSPLTGSTDIPIKTI